MRRAALALGLAALAAAGGAGAEGRGPSLEERLPYTTPADPARTLDLYLPERGAAPVPLVAFVHSRYFDRADRADAIARDFARPLQRAGAAVAVIRHRLAPGTRHPGPAEDVAAALAFLHERAVRDGIDPARIFAAGHSSGAHLVSLLALDPRYLAAQHLHPSDLAGVAAISGLYDLDPEPEPGGVTEEEIALYEQAFGGRRARRRASPLRLVRADAPRFLVMVAERDAPGVRPAGFAFTEALRAAGHPAAETFLVAGRDHFSVLDLGDERNSARRHLLTLIGLEHEWGTIDDLFGTRRTWRDPPFSTAGFWSSGAPVETHEADPAFLRVLNLLFAKPSRPAPLRPARYHAIDLFAWLAQRGPERVGRGEHLVVTNVRGERSVFELEALRPLRPVIVIGVDDERELFRLTDVYHTRRRQSWDDGPAETWVMARPLGAFLHFREPAPETIDPRAIGRFALDPDSFALVEDDPLAPLDALAPREREIVTTGFHCVSCHSLRGSGGRAAHIRAKDGALVGGYGLALESYPPEVWRRYCFEQAEVAAEIGASAVPLDPPTAQLLYALVERERAEASAAGR